jgi:endonuclease YncB( thermonuclease family)
MAGFIGEWHVWLVIFGVVMVLKGMKALKKIAVSLCLCFLFFGLYATDEINARVVAVLDGNTIEIAAEDNETYKVYFFGIDCPELTQEFGDVAKEFTERMLMNRAVKVSWAGKDRWGNRLAVVIMDGQDFRAEILKRGLAWTVERNPIVELEDIKEQAKAAGRGLWAMHEPTPPWIHRRQQTMLTPKSS